MLYRSYLFLITVSNIRHNLQKRLELTVAGSYGEGWGQQKDTLISMEDEEDITSGDRTTMAGWPESFYRRKQYDI